MSDVIIIRRRWFQFSMRTMFVGLAIVSIGLGWWVNRSRGWMRQRHEVLGTWPIAIENAEDAPIPRAPGGLWIFGEQGVPSIAWNSADNIDFDRVKELFPEAVVYARPSFPAMSDGAFLRDVERRAQVIHGPVQPYFQSIRDRALGDVVERPDSEQGSR